MDRTSQQAGDTATAGVVMRPPLLFLAALLFGFAWDHVLPVPRPIPEIGPVHSVSAVIAGSLSLVGILIFAAAIRAFARAATPVPGTRPTRTLVTTGIYGWSRNPIYLGLLLLYVGIGLATRSPWILLLALPLFFILRYGVVAREEVYLERRFGEAYRDYEARVRRWL
jgi:protein-S-isoprenylcysteine O-methyltransferase Ste14